jgi:hypothetical protein
MNTCYFCNIYNDTLHYIDWESDIKLCNKCIYFINFKIFKWLKYRELNIWNNFFSIHISK